MKLPVRQLSAFLLALAGSLLLLPLSCAYVSERAQETEESEVIYFTLLNQDSETVLFRCADSAAQEVLVCGSGAVWDETTVYYLEEGETSWRIRAADLDGANVRTVFECEEAADFQLITSAFQQNGDWLYLPVYRLNGEGNFQGTVFLCRTDGSESAFCDISHFASAFAAQGTTLYYAYGSPPMAYDALTGQSTQLSDTKVYPNSWIFDIDRDTLYYWNTEYYLTALSLADKAEKTYFSISCEDDVFPSWVHDGYLYYFSDFLYDNANLYRMNLETEDVSLLAAGLPEDRNFSGELTFGKSGAVFVYQDLNRFQREGDYSGIYIGYIPYDGSGAKTVTLDE